MKAKAKTAKAAFYLHPYSDLEHRFPRQQIKLANGETLSYVDCILGSSHILLVIPGYGCDSKYMAYTLAQYAAFQDHRIISVDPRGYGESTQWNTCWSHEENAHDVHLFLDGIGLSGKKSIMVMGYSTGAGTASWLALKYPDSFKAVWLVSGTPLDGLRLPTINSQGKPTRQAMTTKQDAEQFANVVMAPNHSPDIEIFRKDQGTICIDGTDTLPPTDDAGFQIYHRAAMDMRARAQALYANVIFNITPIQTPTSLPTNVLSNKLQCPMIILHGAMDNFVKVKQVRAVTELAIVERWAPLNLLSYYEIPNCGHMFMYDNPTGFQSTYLKALEEQVLQSRRYKNRRSFL